MCVQYLILNLGGKSRILICKKGVKILKWLRFKNDLN